MDQLDNFYRQANQKAKVINKYAEEQLQLLLQQLTAFVTRHCSKIYKFCTIKLPSAVNEVNLSRATNTF